jgi:plastocyanin
MSRVHLVALLLLGPSLWGCGSSGSSITTPGTSSSPRVSIVSGAQDKGTSAFSPNPLTISLANGDAVQWSNDDRPGTQYSATGATHNITSDDNLFTSGNLAPGASFTTHLSVAGKYAYHCSIHPTMKGTITVTP